MTDTPPAPEATPAAAPEATPPPPPAPEATPAASKGRLFDRLRPSNIEEEAVADLYEDDQPFDLERARAKISKTNNEAAALRRRLADAEGRIEQKVAELEQRALQAEVAAEKGLTAAQAKRLVGATVEELQADADELLASFGPQQNPAGSPAGRPTDRPAAGSSDPTQPPVELDPAKLAESVPRSGLY